MKPLLASLSVALAFTACGDTPVALTFVAPVTGTAATRDQVNTATGDLVARVIVEVDIEGTPARVGLTAADAVQPDLVDGLATIDLATTGTVELVATAYDAADAELATASIELAIGDAMPGSCREALALYQVDFQVGPDSEGVDDPVTAAMPINGLAYRFLGSENPRSTMFADCTLLLSLAKAAPIMRARGVVEVTDIGIYNYRCIGGVGTPPNCPNGISQHAFATAIDIAAVTDSEGETAVVNDDWVIDPNAEETCEAPTEPGKDQQLHELICALKQAAVWNIVLTPNYNAAHRDHFHVDLTPDSNFIEKRSH